MQIICSLAVIFALGLYAQTPRLTPRVVMPGEAVGATFWMFAPDIAVVKVTSAELQGPEVEITPPGKTAVRLVRVDGQVENVIQGELRTGPTRFYFFVNTLSGGYTTYKYWLTPGGRYVVFLREDGGVLRTMADLAPPQIRVLTGHHGHINVLPGGPTGRGPGLAILEAALNPQPDYEKGFASQIQGAMLTVEQFVRRADLAAALRNLLVHPDPAIQAHACLALAIGYRYRDPCLPGLLNASDIIVKRQAEIWGPRESTRELLTALRENPLSLVRSDKIEDLEGELELFTLDSDEGVRGQACETLFRLFPSEVLRNCKPGGK
jgi:hypothetical protein